jgi:2-oxo-3-hexenedioate decarboxylase/2-keto-4-pentenoate hydratase
MDRAAILAAAERLAEGRLRRVAMEGLPDALRPADEAEAYRVQAALHDVLAAAGLGAIAGHKIGCTTAVMQAYLRIANPCAGGVLAPTVHHRNAVLPHAGFVRVGVECELAVRLGADLPARGTPHDRASVAPAVEAVMASIEVVDDRWADYPSIDTPTLIADDFFGAGCVLGEPVRDWRGLDLQGLGGHMAINGEVVGRGHGRDILGHPLEALAWLANSMIGRGATLRAGELVTLGSLVATRWLGPGDRATIEIEGLGRVSAHFA